MSVFRLVEGLITSVLKGSDGTDSKVLRTKTDGTLLTSQRPSEPLGYAYFDGIYSAEVNKLFNFHELRKDIIIAVDKPIKVKLNSILNSEIFLADGDWRFIDEYANKMYITFIETTNIQIYANG